MNSERDADTEKTNIKNHEYITEVLLMPSITLRAHFNGKQVVFDEPFTLEPNVKLLVTVLPVESDAERDDWLRFSAEGLKAAYGDNEPEYSPADLKETNPEYDRR